MDMVFPLLGIFQLGIAISECIIGKRHSVSVEFQWSIHFSLENQIWELLAEWIENKETNIEYRQIGNNGTLQKL